MSGRRRNERGRRQTGCEDKSEGGGGWTDLFEDVAGDVGKRDGGVDITDIYMPCSRGLPRSPNREGGGIAITTRPGRQPETAGIHVDLTIR
jgi:hypothetical protein